MRRSLQQTGKGSQKNHGYMMAFVGSREMFQNGGQDLLKDRTLLFFDCFS